MLKRGAFANMRSRYKEIGKKVPQAYLRYVEDTFLPCDAVDALRFAKESDYGFKDYSPAYARFITEDPIRDGRLIVYILVHY